MQKYKKPDTKILDVLPNPFTNSLVIHTRTMSNPTQFVHEEGILNHVTYTVETDPVTKLYVNSDKRLHINKLSGQSSKLFLWIMYTIDSGKDYLWINKERVMLELGISSINTYKKSIEELVLHQIIHITSVKDTYWINPAYFFKGDRSGKYSKCVVKESLKE